MNSVLCRYDTGFLESTQRWYIDWSSPFLDWKKSFYRDQFLLTITDPKSSTYWQRFPLLKESTANSPVLTRLDSFLRPKLIHNMVSQKTSLDFTLDELPTKSCWLKLSGGLNWCWK
jgi:hypothetical protein